ncbi:MAG: hypothetical protein ACI9F9_000935 [Candidatus Paceibacteria bacterium]|jgi:hypothetical protein
MFEMTFLLLASLVVLLVMGWGPGNHLEFGERVYRRRRDCLPRDVSTLLGEERDAYFYGSIAADIINFKAWGGEYNHCHRWDIIDSMRELARTPSQEAFIYGYLAHLAADTIAHNHFVPYHLCRYARTKGLGHLYWELNADRFVAEARWKIIPGLKQLDELEGLDELVNATVPKKALPMTTNKVIFNHVLLVSERDAWRKMMERIHPRKQVGLQKGFLSMFQKAACERVLLALHPKGFQRIRSVDPNGKSAQKRAFEGRKNILHRLAPGRRRVEESEARALPFLEGMGEPQA